MDVDGAEEGDDLAVMATLIGDFWVRSLRRNWACFDGDLTMAYILAEIAVYNVSSLHAAPANCRSLSQHLLDGTHYLLLKPCNAFSIAEATGLPRETVRRKFLRLEELGWITRAPEGGFVVSAHCIDHTWQQFYPQAFFELRETFDRLRLHLPDKWFARTTTAGRSACDDGSE